MQKEVDKQNRLFRMIRRQFIRERALEEMERKKRVHTEYRTERSTKMREKIVRRRVDWRECLVYLDSLNGKLPIYSIEFEECRLACGKPLLLGP